MPRLVLTASLLLLSTAIAWVVIGPRHPAFPWVFSAGVFGILGISGPWPESHAPRWVTAATQRTIDRAKAFGIPAMLRALDRVGWNRALGRRGDARHGRAGLVVIRDKATQSVIAHGVGAATHLLVAVSVAVVGAWWGALTVLLLGVLIHLIPVAMQRYVIARIDRVDRSTQARIDERSRDS